MAQPPRWASAAAVAVLLLPAAAGVPTGMTFGVTASSAVAPITAKEFEVTAVKNAPPGTTWLLLDTVAGPRFSGLPVWFPLDAQSDVTTVAWWSEYFDRDDSAHDPIDPAHGAGVVDIGQYCVSLSAWKGRNGTLLGNASDPAVIHYDKSYTALRWNISAAPHAAPGAVRLTLTPADDASTALSGVTSPQFLRFSP